MKTVKLTKTALQLLYGKKVGDTLVVYRTRKYPEKRQSTAVLLLLDNDYIQFLRRSQYEDNDYGRRRPDLVTVFDYKVLKVPQ